jgi:hypothetical protein
MRPIRIFITLSLLFCFGIVSAQTDGEDVVYGSFKLRKNKQVTCIPDSLIDKVVVQTDEDASRKKGTLKGTVSVHNSSHRAVPGSFVSVYEGDVLVGYTLSDSEGKYILGNLKGGRYRVEVCRLGYEYTAVHGIVVKSANTTFVDVQLHGTYQTHTTKNDLPIDSIGCFRIRMRKTETPKAPGSIQGVVTLINNEFPLEKVVIELFQDGKKIKSVSCNKKGKFALLKLPDGMYEVNIITDRNNNDLVPGVEVSTGKTRMIEVSIKRNGKARGRR